MLKINLVVPGLVLLVACVMTACRHTERTPKTQQELSPSVGQPAGDTYTGNIAAIDRDAGIIKVNLLLKSQLFEVGPDTEIITAKGAKSTLKNLKVGDPVDVAYTAGADIPVAQRITVKGITEDDREERRDEERMEEILNPTPSERAP